MFKMMVLKIIVVWNIFLINFIGEVDYLEYYK